MLRSYLKRETGFFFASAYGDTIVAEARRQFSATLNYRTALPGQAPEERLMSFLCRISQRLQIWPGDPLELPFSTTDIAAISVSRWSRSVANWRS